MANTGGEASHIFRRFLGFFQLLAAIGEQGSGAACVTRTRDPRITNALFYDFFRRTLTLSCRFFQV
jgi:hypothetical protein